MMRLPGVNWEHPRDIHGPKYKSFMQIDMILKVKDSQHSL